MRRYFVCPDSVNILTFYVVKQRPVHDAALTVISNVVGLIITTELNINRTKKHIIRGAAAGST